MKLLIDTNIFIPLEPTSHKDKEANTPKAAILYRYSNELSYKIYIHPLIISDIRKDSEVKRRHLREELATKYLVLPNPPSIEDPKYRKLFSSQRGSNDWIDDHLLLSVHIGMVDYLITEDIKIHTKASKLGLSSKVLTLNSILQTMKKNFDQVVLPPPSVIQKYAHELDLNDTLFDSVKKDYPDFTNWFTSKCINQHRVCYVIEDKQRNKIIGLSIIKQENGVFNLGYKVLKICLFKIAEEDRGNRLGELLLKTIFEYCEENKYEGTFLTIKPEKGKEIRFFEAFGFERCGQDKKDIVFGKRFRFTPSEEQNLDAFDFHRKFGPGVTKYDGNCNYIIPIKPKYYYALFPEEEKNIDLFPRSQPYSNSIKKIYISRSRIRGIERGDNLLFYISDLSKLGSVGIVENVLRTSGFAKLKNFVKNITVYPDNELKALLKTEVVAIQFRRVKFIKKTITLKELIKNGILLGAPQSITKIAKGKTEWLKTKT